MALLAGGAMALSNVHVELIDKSVREGDTINAVVYIPQPPNNTTLFYTIVSSDGTTYAKKGFVVDGERELLAYDVPYPSDKGIYTLSVEIYTLSTIDRYSESFTVTDNRTMDYSLGAMGVLSLTLVYLVARRKRR